MAPLRLIPALGSPIEITQDVAPIGREHSAVVRLTDVSVSRRHARIELRGTDWVLVDLGSANGSYVDGTQVDGELALRNGQEIRFGDMTYRVEILANSPAPGAVEDDEALPTVFHFKPPPPPGIAPAPVRVAVPATAPPPRPEHPEPSATETVSPTDSTLVAADAETLVPRSVPMAAVRAAISAPPGTPAPPTAPGPPGAPPGAPSAMPAAPRSSLAPPARRAPAESAPARRGRGPMFWAVVGSLGCLSLAGLIVGLGYATLVSPAKGAIAVVQGQLDEIRQGNLSKAHSRLQADYQTRVPLAEFERFVAAHPSLSNNLDALFWPPSGSARVERNRAYLNGVLVAVSGVREQVAYELAKEGDAWRISALRVEGREPEVHQPQAAAPPTTIAEPVAPSPDSLPEAAVSPMPGPAISPAP